MENIRTDIAKVRLNALLDAYTNGIHSPDDMLKEANKKGGWAGNRLGHVSEKIFQDKTYSCFGWLIASIKHANDAEESQGIDFILTFRETSAYPHLSGASLPAQIKSSSRKVDQFRNSNHYQQLGKKIIIMAMKPKIPDGEFENSFRRELARISRLFENETDLTGES